MEINLFHLLKSSNAQLILFDCLMDWFKRHEGNIIQNGYSSLMKRENFLQGVNSKLYHEEILMKLKVNKIIIFQDVPLILLPFQPNK